MTMGFKTCPHCDDGEAEALCAVDGKIEWYCHECGASWTCLLYTSDAADEEDKA